MERANPTMSTTNSGKNPKSWKDPVYFTPRDNHVSLTQHFKTGTCERAAMGRLESQAKRNPQRCVYESFDEFVKGCNAHQRKQKMKEYSKSSYEAAIAFFRELGIIPHTKQGTRVRCLVNFDGCDKAPGWREGWIVAPHDFMTHKHHGACHFVGFGNSPDFPFNPRRGPKIWVPRIGEGIELQNQVATKVGVRCDQGATKVRLRCDQVAN